MKYKLIIDEEQDEKIIIYAHEKNKLVYEIEELIKSYEYKLIGHTNNISLPINLTDVSSFYTKDNKVYANVLGKPYSLNLRIYQIEEIVNSSFIKINQGCIVNINKISNFETSLGGFVKVNLKDGFSDYISRRELKNVKRRMGLWIKILKSFYIVV